MPALAAAQRDLDAPGRLGKRTDLIREALWLLTTLTGNGILPLWLGHLIVTGKSNVR